VLDDESELRTPSEKREKPNDAFRRELGQSIREVDSVLNAVE
jgi:hypothetical protein